VTLGSPIARQVTMHFTTVSSKFQMVIPLAVCKSLGLVPGAKLQVVQFEDRIEVIPIRSARTLRGALAGLDSRVPRDGHRV
jgi:AbrB family looped-hinge helix DNA binding protein